MAVVATAAAMSVEVAWIRWCFISVLVLRFGSQLICREAQIFSPRPQKNATQPPSSTAHILLFIALWSLWQSGQKRLSSHRIVENRPSAVLHPSVGDSPHQHHHRKREEEPHDQCDATSDDD